MPSGVPVKIQKILDEAEKKKKQGDLEFTRSKYQEAIETYSTAISYLIPLRSTPYGELCALKCLTNQIQCYIRLGDYNKAIAISQFALTIPVVVSEIHLLQKICIRCANAYESLEKYDVALGLVDKAISADAISTDYDEIRERLISKLNTSENIVPILPRPQEFPSREVTKVIGEILKSRGDCEALAPLLNELCVRRVHLDRRDDRNYNIMWALSQVAVMRSNQPTENPDDIFPLLQLVLLNGVAAEQRFVSNDPSKKDKSAGQTPLMLFALAGAVDCVKLLLKMGASVATCDEEGWIPLMIACTPAHPRVTPESLASGKPSSNDEMVELLIEAKSPVNAQNFMGLTPLICAAQAGDLQSAALLIHGGALINLRSANGFSPIIWALTAKIPNHEMIQLLLDACLTTPSVVKENDAKEKENNNGNEPEISSTLPTQEQRIELQKELVEDMKCYKIGYLSLKLKIAVKEFVTKYENTQKAVGKEVTRPAPYLIHRKIVETIGFVTNVVAEAGGPSEMTAKYLTTIPSIGLYSAILHNLQTQVLPDSLFYRYLPITSVQEAVTQAPLIEQARLSIMMSAAYGETKEPLLSQASHQDFLLCTRHVDYAMLIREPMVNLLSPCVPTNEALALISMEKNILYVLGVGGDYWVKNLQEVTQGMASFDMKLVRSGSVARHFPSPYFLENSFYRSIETVTSLQQYSSRTLVMIWPMCQMLSTTSRELVEKDEELLLSFEGKRILLLGDVNYNPLQRTPTVRDHLMSHYECIDTIPLPNWKDFQNSLTIWSKLN